MRSSNIVFGLEGLSTARGACMKVVSRISSRWPFTTFTLPVLLLTRGFGVPRRRCSCRNSAFVSLTQLNYTQVCTMHKPTLYTYNLVTTKVVVKLPEP
jgi:hypothetical protein